MLEILQTGKALYVLAAFCGIGVITRWLTRNLYKRLIKESDNMMLTKNKCLRAFKQKTESTYQMNQGIPRIKPYLERQMYDFKYMGVTLHGWNIFSNQMTLWCFLAGGAAAFGSYWYRTDPYYIVLYGSVGIMAGLFTILVDHGAGITEKRQQLFAVLDNYLENILIYRLDQARDEFDGVSGPSPESRENIRSIYPSQATEPVKETRQDRRSARQRLKAERPEKPVRNRLQTQQAETHSDEAEAEKKAVSQEPVSSRRDVDYLKRSLEQIAASRERERGNKSGEDWIKELNPEELKLIGEIFQEYLT
ncbi:hypothetical protein [Clostridium sp. HBUAS56010]|uniref:hypothetical protein n=1 Tax=Clostridium sp. HBUAS56010 TaxID=2571127 RepID=UPI001177A76E|nr:hypothetical protein [Clostridium sp. HBUAS56010]